MDLIFFMGLKMDKPDFKNMSYFHLKSHLSRYRKEVVEELDSREQKERIRKQRSHRIQIATMILSILIFILAILTFFSPFFINRNKVINNISAINPNQPNTDKGNNDSNKSNDDTNIKKYKYIHKRISPKKKIKLN